jgi:hypothetical protein
VNTPNHKRLGDETIPTAQALRPLSIARGQAADKGKIVKQQEVTLAELGDILRRAQAKQVAFTFEELSALRVAKDARDKNAATKLEALKCAPWYTCATFKGSQRDSDHLETSNAIVGDADQPGTTREALIASLDALGVSYVLATSTSHGCGGQDRYRVIVPLAAPVEPSRYEALWALLNVHLGGVLDPGAKDAPRLNYMPRTPKGATGHEVIVVDDRPWLVVAPVAASVAAHTAIYVAEVNAAPAERPQPRYTIEELREKLKTRDPSAPEDVWWRDIRVLRTETGGSPAGCALACEWSRGGTNYTDDQVIINRWNSPSWHDAKNPITIGRWLQCDVAKPTDFPIVRVDPSLDLSARRLRAPFTFDTLPEDILVRQLPARVWALFPYLPKRTTTILSSVGGFGKSHLMLLLAICKALALPNFCDLECEAGRVVILTAEDELAEMHLRAQRILRHLKNLGVTIDPALLAANLQFVDMTGLGAENMLVKAQHLGAIPTDLVEHIAREIGQADIIALDTMSRFSGASENDNTAGAVFISACETIAKLTGAAILVLSHTGKAVAREGIVDQYVSRGASAFSDNARSVVVLASPLKDAMKRFEIDPAAVERGDLFRLAHVKSNYAKRAPDVYFKRLDDGVVAPFNPTPKLAASGDELSLRLLAYIGKREIRHSDVYKNFGKIFDGRAARDQALEVFDSAIRDGKLIRKRSYRNADYYVLADTSFASVIDAPMQSKPPCEAA